MYTGVWKRGDATPLVRKAWRKGELVIRARVAIGAHVNAGVMCITTRERLRHNIEAAAGVNFGSVVGAIREAVTATHVLTDKQDQNLMDDLAMLMGIVMSRKDEPDWCHVIVNCAGLSKLGLIVDENARLAWDKRGFFTPQHVRAPIGRADESARLTGTPSDYKLPDRMMVEVYINQKVPISEHDKLIASAVATAMQPEYDGMTGFFEKPAKDGTTSAYAHVYREIGDGKVHVFVLDQERMDDVAAKTAELK